MNRVESNLSDHLEKDLYLLNLEYQKKTLLRKIKSILKDQKKSLRSVYRKKNRYVPSKIA
jgi:hypothetical protein